MASQYFTLLKTTWKMVSWKPILMHYYFCNKAASLLNLKYFYLKWFLWLLHIYILSDSLPWDPLALVDKPRFFLQWRSLTRHHRPVISDRDLSIAPRQVFNPCLIIVVFIVQCYCVLEDQSSMIRRSNIMDVHIISSVLCETQ